MFWMIHEALGIGNLFDFSGLTNGDAAARADADEFAAMIFDLEGLMISSLLLVVSCEIHWINGSSVSRVSMFITIIFYVLSFFNVSKTRYSSRVLEKHPQRLLMNRMPEPPA